jgi:ATP-dependent DNA helicase RecG
VVVLTEDSPLTKLVKKGEAEQLARTKGLTTVGDLFEFVPRRYVQPGQLTDLSSVQVGEDVLVVAEVARATSRPMRNRRGKMLTVVLTDDHGHELDVTFFSAYGHEGKLLPGARGFFVGSIGAYGRRLQLTHPEYELFDDDAAAGEAAVEWYRAHRVPVYSTTGRINSLQLRRLVHTALDSVDRIREPVPEQVRVARGLVDRAAALELVHRPLVDDQPSKGLDRLKYDEAFVLQTILGCPSS